MIEAVNKGSANLHKEVKKLYAMNLVSLLGLLMVCVLLEENQNLFR